MSPLNSDGIYEPDLEKMASAVERIFDLVQAIAEGGFILSEEHGKIFEKAYNIILNENAHGGDVAAAFESAIGRLKRKNKRETNILIKAGGSAVN